jgi:hypothetical protein
MILVCAEHGAEGLTTCCGESEESKSAAPESGAAEAGGAARAEAAAPPAPQALRRSGLADAGSYADAFRMLSDENSCSRFYGGPRMALTVLNGLALQLRKHPLGPGAVGMRMSGGYKVYRDDATGESYRLFKEAFVNSDGPFLLRIVAPRSARLQIGRFPAETRQAKALLLLHELGHLVGAPGGGGWLLPDDGGDTRQSERNTQTVESRCLKQLLALGT